MEKRIEAGEALMKRILGVAATVENECSDREQGDGELQLRTDGIRHDLWQLQLRMDVIGHELSKEVEERTEEMGTYCREMHIQESKFEQQFIDFKHMFDLEGFKRSVETLCSEGSFAPNHKKEYS